MLKGLAASLVGLLIWASAPAAARGGMPEPLTESGRIMESIYYQIFVVGVAVFLIVFVLLVWVLWRYREKGGKGRATHEHEREHLGAELTWTVLPLLVLLWVSWISYAGLIELDEGYGSEDAFMTIGIEASQWNWRADYGGGVAMLASPGARGEVADGNVFVVPADVPIRFNLTSVDVIHAFFIQDANLAPVAMVDANPSGPHKYNHITVVFTEGEYRVQCKEMCLNPGHAYMRARIAAVPMAQYEAWLDLKQHEAQCRPRLIQHLELEAGPDGLQGPDGFLATLDACVLVHIENPLDEAVEVHVDERSERVTVAPGTTGYLLVNATEERNVTLGDSLGGSFTFGVIDMPVLNVEFGDMVFRPDRLTVQAGETYLVQFNNVDRVPHNWYVGEAYPDAPEEWHGPDVNGGETGSMLFTAPEEPGEYEFWCNVPGHYAREMHGTLIVE